MKTRDKVVDNKISLFNFLSETIEIDNPKAIAPLIVPEQAEIPFSVNDNLKLSAPNKYIRKHIP